jgi:hypothetical protein
MKWQWSRFSSSFFNFSLIIITPPLPLLIYHIVEKRNAYRILVGMPEEQRPLGRPRHRWDDNIKMDIREIRWGGMDWIHLAQDRDQRRAHVKMIMNLRVPENSGKFLCS